MRFFAGAIGATETIHLNEVAARAAGYRSLVAPPTYVMCYYRSTHYCVSNVQRPDSSESN